MTIATNSTDTPGGAASRDGSLAACLSLALLLVGSYLLNSFVFPSVAVVFPLGREISTCSGALVALVVALVAFRRPSVVREGLWSGFFLGAFGVSLGLLTAGIHQGDRLLIALGSPLGGAGQLWFSVLIGVAFARLGLARCTVCVPTGFAIAYFIQGAFEALGVLPGYALGIVLYFLCTALAYALVRRPVRQQLAVIRESQPPQVLDATNPHSFLPLSSKVFIAMGLFSAALGYAFGSGMAVTHTPFAIAAFVPVLGLFLAMAVLRRHVSSDGIYLLATMLVVGGLLLVPLRHATAFGSPVLSQMPPLLLQSGTDCFSLLTYLLVGALGERNPIGSLSVSASACAASHFGIACGATAAQGIDLLAAGTGDGATLSLLALAAITLAFVGFNLVAMKNFSFEQLVRGIRPVPGWLALGTAGGSDRPSPAADTGDFTVAAADGDDRFHEPAGARRAPALASAPADDDRRRLAKLAGTDSAHCHLGELPDTGDAPCYLAEPTSTGDMRDPLADPPSETAAPGGTEQVATPIQSHRNASATGAPRPLAPKDAHDSRTRNADNRGRSASFPNVQPDTLDERCERVARRYQLTPREADVLALLARGRTSPIIQEKLVVSQNTVRTHVRHIYAKLDVHSQQELINLVDAA